MLDSNMLLQLGVGGALAIIMIIVVLKMVFEFISKKKNNTAIAIETIENKITSRINSFENRFDIKHKEVNQKLDCIKKENLFISSEVKSIEKDLSTTKDITLKNWELHDHDVDGVPVWWFPTEVREKITKISTDNGNQTMHIRDIKKLLSDMKNRSNNKN